MRADGRDDREAWILATIPRALAFAGSLLKDRSIAEDVVHDCYVRLIEKAATYDLARDGTRLLYKAITNACIDRNYRDRRLLSFEVGPEADGEGASSVIDDRAADPLEIAAHRELLDAVKAGLARLSVAQKGALELRSLGYSLPEIAEAIGVTPVNAGVLVHRARKALGEMLAPFLARESDDD